MQPVLVISIEPVVVEIRRDDIRQGQLAPLPQRTTRTMKRNESKPNPTTPFSHKTHLPKFDMHQHAPKCL
jgi:hypothetical protein